MSQPDWKFLVNLGDVNPIDHGGYFVYEDATGVYQPEAELLDVSDIDGKDQWTVHRFTLDRLKLVEDPETHTVYLVPFRYEEGTWPYPASRYDEWFHKDLGMVAMTMDRDFAELRDALCSDNALVRAQAYRDMADYYGHENFDSYPLTLTDRKAVEARYAKELK